MDSVPIIQISIILRYETFGIPLLNVSPRVFLELYEKCPCTVGMLHQSVYNGSSRSNCTHSAIAPSINAGSFEGLIKGLNKALTLTARNVVMPRATRAGAAVSLTPNPIQDITTHMAYQGDPSSHPAAFTGKYRIECIRVSPIQPKIGPPCLKVKMPIKYNTRLVG